MSKKVKLPMSDIRAQFMPGTIDDDKRTVELTWTTGARVLRNSMWDGPWYEELEVSEQAVKLDRLNRGGPLLKDHVASLDAQIGVVERAWLEGSEGRALVRFSKRDDAEKIYQDVKDGIVRSISVGYVRSKVEKVGMENNIPIYRATEWEPMELSLLPIPADASAQVRSFDNVECEIITNNREDTMIEEKRAVETVQTPDLEALKREAIEAERKRSNEIRLACRAAKLDVSFADGLIEKGVSVDEARKLVIDEIAKKPEAETRASNVTVGQNLDHVALVRGVSEAMAHRINPVKNQLSEVSHNYRYMRLLDLAKVCLRAKGFNCDSYAPMEIASRSLHSTSDFVDILANVANKTLRDAYQESPQTFNGFTRRVQAVDFKEISRVQLGDYPKFKEKVEGAEYQYGTIGQSAEKYSVKTYGAIVGLTREALVNDDLDSFARVPTMAGRQAANLESDLIWSIITGNPLMADGFALFSSQHANLAAGGDIGAPAVATLGTAREAMRLQKSLNGSHLNLVPLYLIVPANLETVADQLVTSITPNQASQVNPFAPSGRTPMQVVVEPRLDAASATNWYVAASTAQVDILELATMVGEDMPVIDSMIDFDTDGVKFKARHTVGVKAIDYRGLYKNPAS